MLFDHLTVESPELDVLQVVGTLDEQLDERALACAWDSIVRRHPALRTGFRWQGAEAAVRIVDPGVRIPLAYLDWRRTPIAEKELQVERLADRERASGFDLARPPLARLVLVRTEPSRYVLILTVHHVLMDALSFPVLMEELFTIYEAELSGGQVSLPALRAEEVEGGITVERDGTADDAFWKDCLRGLGAPTALLNAGALDANGVSASRRAEQETRLSEETSAALARLAASHGVTLNTVVQSAWAILLSRYTGEEDVVFGAVRRVAAPAPDGTDVPVGLFINTLPMRVRVTGSTRVSDLLRTVRADHVAARPHKYSSLVEIRRLTEIPGRTALFDTFVVFNHASIGRMLSSLGGGWSGRKFRLLESLSSIPVGLYVYADSGLLLKLVYDRTRLDDAAAIRAVGHFECLLTGLAHAAGGTIAQLPMLTSEETRLLDEWNDTGQPGVPEACVQDRIEGQARETPDAVALVAEGEQITYRELDRRANAFAAELQRRGVGPDVLVGVYLDRTIDLVVSILAVLKAGGAYVPLDPDYPRARLEYVLRDAGVRLVITQARMAGDLPPATADLIRVGDLNREAQSGAEAPPARAACPANLAYVIYTSGSTGNPKGVMVEHRNVTNFFRAMDDRLSGGPGEKWLAVTSLAFDISVVELLWTLARGFTVVIYPGEVARSDSRETTADAFRVGEYLARHRITHMQCTPSMAAMMAMDQECCSGLRSLRLLLVGGEPFPRSLAVELRSLTHAEIVNMYGPTETTIWSSTFTLSDDGGRAGDGDSVVSIGRPVVNTTFHVVDHHLARLPPGVAGELLIGGAGVARGYLNLPALTAERFIDDPFDGAPDARLYRTGDLVRFAGDGYLEFLGRMDNQIKLRGHRIEPADIEQKLRSHPGVEQAAVVIREIASSDKHLLACVVPTKGARPTAQELLEHLRRLLPEYMVPGEFVLLDRLPLTPNKKLDRKALSALRPSPDAAASREAPPEEGLEAEVAQMWARVLGAIAVGRDDNFFDLGGDSFRAMKLHHALRTALGRNVSLTDIFAYPTIRSLAAFLESQSRDGGEMQSGVERGRMRRQQRARGRSRRRGGTRE
jgi:amino acid adenylation domain-containing protein